MEDTLLGSPVLGSAESTSTITGAMEGVLLECSDTETAPLEPKADPPPLKPQFKRLSGAARRRKKRLAAAQEAAQVEGGQATGETILVTPQQDQPTTSTQEEPVAIRLWHRPNLVRLKRGPNPLGIRLKKQNQLLRERSWITNRLFRSLRRSRLSLEMTQPTRLLKQRRLISGGSLCST